MCLPATAANPPKRLPAFNEPCAPRYLWLYSTPLQRHRERQIRRSGQGGMSQPSALIPSGNYPFHPLDFLTDYVICIPGQRLNGWLRADEAEQDGLSTYTPIFCHAPLCMAIPLDGPKMIQRVRVWNKGIYY